MKETIKETIEGTINQLGKQIIELKSLIKMCVVKGCEEDGEIKDDNLNYICRYHVDKFNGELTL
jgi:hypothetical protein